MGWIADSAAEIAARAGGELEALVGVSSPSGDAPGAEEVFAIVQALLPARAAVERGPWSRPAPPPHPPPALPREGAGPAAAARARRHRHRPPRAPADGARAGPPRRLRHGRHEG